MKKTLKKFPILFICLCIMLTITTSPYNYYTAKASYITSNNNDTLKRGTTFDVKSLANTGEDKERFVLTIMGDGYTASEQDTFNQKAQEMSDYILSSEPFSDKKDKINTYAIDVISNESGAAMDPSSPLDTYFGCSYNNQGIERLLCYTKGNPAGVARANVPYYDFAVILVNSEKDGGSGGDIAVLSADESMGETVLHELGHVAGGLTDEYWYMGEESPNCTQESDPSKVRWKDFIGTDGVGVYSYSDSEGAGWYHPGENCKMEALDNPFCAVCSDTISKQIDKYASSTSTADSSDSSGSWSDGNTTDSSDNEGSSGNWDDWDTTDSTNDDDASGNWGDWDTADSSDNDNTSDNLGDSDTTNSSDNEDTSGNWGDSDTTDSSGSGCDRDGSGGILSNITDFFAGLFH